MGLMLTIFNFCPHQWWQLICIGKKRRTKYEREIFLEKSYVGLSVIIERHDSHSVINFIIEIDHFMSTLKDENIEKISNKQ
ncbi:hypothetical protein D5876_10560 [Salmonella enterica subsp. enterica serovar Carno]|nr:hypothetical protein DZA58_20890 [Salmonella enterica subsp. enterica serovar Fresno]EAA7368290.1 hypothetical protein [Salmonella enterica subsp. enterica]EAM3236674.1 hypothetical protein [Salmonella enterica]EBS0850554.1 hypothetical protein [Salmonella enterica subsp. enterica serovar Carno]EBW2074184.1 hypothetical protein [Salmonella enterica subsp. enterica serovar Krefeld]PVN11462.1 hypothetical protein C4769_07730 [Salmonella enterica subsp. enterica serovar Elomrane]